MLIGAMLAVLGFFSAIGVAVHALARIVVWCLLSTPVLVCLSLLYMIWATEVVA